MSSRPLARAPLRGSVATLLLVCGGCPPGIPVPQPTPMVSLPAASFTMGKDQSCHASAQPICDPSSRAERTVTLSPFSIDQFEVTNAQYRYCVAVGQCEEPSVTGTSQIPDYYDNDDYADHPVVFVTWAMAVTYCRFVGRRLPTEAQWEYAARGNKGIFDARSYPWGDEPPDCDHARLKGCGRDLLAAVGTVGKDQSSFGVRDLGGNVSEWVQDFYERYQYCRDGKSLSETCGGDTSCISSMCFDSGNQPRPECVLLCEESGSGNTPDCLRRTGADRDPSGPVVGTERVFRGGSVADGPCSATAYFRRFAPPNVARASLGFRCAN